MREDYSPALLLLALCGVAAVVMWVTAIQPLFERTADAWRVLAGF